MWWIEHIFAGALAYVLHWGTGAAIIAGCLACIFAMGWVSTIPLIGPPLAKVSTRMFIEIAVITAVFMGGMWVGDHDRAARVAQQKVIVKEHVKGVVDGTKTPSSEQATDPYADPNLR